MTAIALSTNSLYMPVLGYMPMPLDFPYRKIFHIGRPRHGKFSDFGLRHPSMSCSHRAKIFAPFDALTGFDERIEKKEVLYEPPRKLSQEETEDLNKALSLLQALIPRKKASGASAPKASVTYFLPCIDQENEAYGSQGSYITLRGIVNRIDPLISKSLTLEETVIPLGDIRRISNVESGECLS